MPEEKLERKAKPNRYCPTCLGYGMITMRATPFNNNKVQTPCHVCHGSGWVYEDK